MQNWEGAGQSPENAPPPQNPGAAAGTQSKKPGLRAAAHGESLSPAPSFPLGFTTEFALQSLKYENGPTAPPAFNLCPPENAPLPWAMN